MTGAGRLGIAGGPSAAMAARGVPPNRSRACVGGKRAWRGAARASRLDPSSRAVALVPHRLDLIRGPRAQSRCPQAMWAWPRHVSPRQSRRLLHPNPPRLALASAPHRYRLGHQSKEESGGERMGDARLGNPFVMTEQEEWEEGWSVSEREKENSNVP